MIRPFLSINSNENLTVRNLDADNKDLVLEVDINSDYDGSLRKFATFVRENNINSFSCSSTIDDSDENGIDSMMLDTFLDSILVPFVALCFVAGQPTRKTLSISNKSGAGLAGRALKVFSKGPDGQKNFKHK